MCLLRYASLARRFVAGVLFLSHLSLATQQNLCIRPHGCTTQRPEELTAPEIEAIPFPGSAAIPFPGGNPFPCKSSYWWTWQDSKSLAALPFCSKEKTTWRLSPCEILKRGISKSWQHHFSNSFGPVGWQSPFVAQAFLVQLMVPLVCSSRLFQLIVCLVCSSHLSEFHSVCIATLARQTTRHAALLQTNHVSWRFHCVRPCVQHAMPAASLWSWYCSCVDLGLLCREPTATVIRPLFAMHLVIDRERENRPSESDRAPPLPEGTGDYTREGKSGGHE